MEDLIINETLTIPARELEFTAVASGGPGGFVSTAGVTRGTVTLILKEKRKARVSEIRDRIRPKLLAMAQAARRTAITDADERLADACIAVAGGAA